MLVLLTITTAVSSATVVALFGIRPTVEKIINPSASFPLTTYDEYSSFFINGDDGGLFAIGNPFQQTQAPKLSGFMYRAAYIEGQKMTGEYISDKDRSYGIGLRSESLSEQGFIGSTMYEFVNTGGIGLNVASYLQYSGVSNGFNLPGKYEFDRINATVYGTNITVTCQDVSSEYIASSFDAIPSITDVNIMVVGKPGGSNITLVDNTNDRYRISTRDGLAIASHLARPIDEDYRYDPIQTIIITSADNYTAPRAVYECSYAGREYLAEISVASSTSPLHIERVIAEGPPITAYFKRYLADTIHGLISIGGNTGGNLAQGFIDAEYSYDGRNITGMKQALETVLGQVGEAYISLLRQMAERSNLAMGYDEGSFSSLRLYTIVSRVGGGSHIAWVAVLGLMLIGTTIGTFRSLCGVRGVGFEAQDAVRLLRATLNNPDITGKTRIGYRNGIVVIGSNGSQGQWSEGNKAFVQAVHSQDGAGPL